MKADDWTEHTEAEARAEARDRREDERVRYVPPVPRTPYPDGREPAREIFISDPHPGGFSDAYLAVSLHGELLRVAARGTKHELRKALKGLIARLKEEIDGAL